MLPTPLLSRMLIIDIAPPSVDDWKDWMDATHGDKGWARSAYVFLKRFEAENYLIQVPRTPEGLDAYPVPRTWTALATLMANNLSDSETIQGLVGEEVGIKFGAFLKVDVDLNDLMREPMKFVELNEDARYMTALMLSSWIGDHLAKPERAFPLIDAMSGESREYLLLTCLTISRRKLVLFLKNLFIGLLFGF